MASFLERSKDADLDQLVRELASRTRGNRRRSLRLLAWKVTVKASYATKRLMDIVLSAVGMLLLSPVYLAIAAAVKLSSPGPVFFVQTRVGRYGRYFKFYKFRSMRQDAEAQKAALMARSRREVCPLSISASRSVSQVSDAPFDQRRAQARRVFGISIASGGAAQSPAISRGFRPAQADAASAVREAQIVRSGRGLWPHS